MPKLRQLDSCGLHPTNQPSEVAVRVDDQHHPTHVQTRGGEWREVEVLERWLIQDKWWRQGEEVNRMYFEVVDSLGHTDHVFYDLIQKGWFRQRYHGPQAG